MLTAGTPRPDWHYEVFRKHPPLELVRIDKPFEASRTKTAWQLFEEGQQEHHWLVLKNEHERFFDDC